MKLPSLITLLMLLPLCHAQESIKDPGLLLQPKKGAPIKGDAHYSFGNLQISPGSVVHQLLCGDQAVGLYFSSGSYSVGITDPYSKPVAERNLKSIPRSKRRGTLLAGLVWTSETVPGPEGSAQAEPLDWASEMLEDAQFPTPLLDMVEARISQTPGMIYALLKVADSFGTQYYVYQRDPLNARKEKLWFLDRYTANTGIAALKGAMIPHLIAVQPLQGSWWEQQPAALVSTRDVVSIDNPKGDHLSIVATSTLQATRPVHTWRANLLTNVWTNRNLPRFNKVTSVKINDREVAYLHHRHELLVVLDRAYQPGEAVTVTTATEGEIAIRLGGNQYWVLGTEPWYPQPNLNGHLAKIDISVRCPIGLQPFASGDRVSLEKDGDHHILKTHFETPMQFPVAAAGKWQFFSEEKEGLTCNVGTNGIKREKGANHLINSFFMGAAYYQHLFDTPYPFGELTILERNIWSYGQAPPGMMFLSKDAFGSRFEWGYDIFSQGLNERYAHEIAHAWWGHLAKAASLEETWITEGFASYSSALLLQAAKGDQGDALFRKMARHWQGNTRKIGKGGSLYLANYLADFSEKVAIDRYYLLYNKAPLVVHALRLSLAEQFGEEMGERMFFGTLQKFIKDAPYGWRSTHDLIKILDHYTKGRWQPWFERYVYGTETPDIRIR